MNEALQQILKKYYEQNYFTGAICLVKKDDETIAQLAYGYQNEDRNVPINETSIFDLASVSKLFTTTMILKLITDRTIQLDSTLKDTLPKVKGNSVLERITIKQLLTHSSGLLGWYPFYSELPNDDLYAILNKIPLEHHEDKTVYSDLNFILLGEVIKQQTNKSLQDAVTEHIVKPLKMDSLTYGPIPQDGKIVATEFGNQIEMKMCADRNKQFDNFRDTTVPIVGEVNDGNCHYFFKGQSGHAGLFANANDVSKLGELYLKGGFTGEKAYIDEALIFESMKDQIDGRGLGWQINAPFPTGCGHTGFTGTSLWLVPKKRLQVVLLTNRLNVEKPTNINKFREEIFSQVLNTIH